MKISHECPLALLERSKSFNDYDYALVHLFEKYPEYYEFFVRSLEQEREVILDNSLFELGESFDIEKYAEWVKKLMPTWYILPDVRNDHEKTLQEAEKFLKQHKLSSMAIGVVHGRTKEEMLQCYLEMENMEGVVKIAFPVYSEAYLHEAENIHGNKYEKMMLGRWMTIMYIMSFVDKNNRKPHHLLGVSLPQEVCLYSQSEYFNTDQDSIDTSNPVLHAMRGIVYNDYGLNNKCSDMMCDMMEEDVESDMLSIQYNINKFRDFASEISLTARTYIESSFPRILRKN